MGRGWTLVGARRATAPVRSRGGGLTRRAALRSGLVWAAGTAAGASLLGGGSLADAAGLTPAASNPIVLLWRPWYNFPNGTSPAALSLMQKGIEPWLAQHPGVQVKITTLGYQGATVAALLAGTGPDIFEDWVLPAYIENNLVYNFEPLARQDNVNMSIFPSGEMEYFYAAGRFAPGGAGGLYCLPAYIHTLAMAVNLGILDEMGLKYPEPDWTYEQWTNLWRTTTVHSSDSSKVRYGGNMYLSGYDYHGGGNPAPFYLRGFGGGYVNPSDATKCYLDHPGSIQCLEWAYSLMQEGVIGYNTFHTGHQVSTPRGTAGGLPYSAVAWRGVKWDLFAMPVWPQGRFTFAASDFYAISSGTKRPDLAWSFLKFLCVEKHWQRFMMGLALNGPNQADLYEEWKYVVQQVAPPLRGKNLDVIVQAVQNDEPYFGHTFQYADAQAANIINQYTSLAQARKMSVTEAVTQIVRQVNALEATGAATQAKEYAALLAVERLNKATGPVRLSAPPVQGQGVPPKLAPSLMVVDKSKGSYTLLGDGQDVWGNSDNCVYACAPTSSSVETFVCRVVTLSNVSCPSISPWAKVGLMARGDLSDNAPMVNLDVTGANGLALQERPLTTAGPGNENGDGGKTGLMAAQYATAPLSKKLPNYLLRPIWLKLERKGTVWSAYTSLDGKTWTKAGNPVPVEMDAAWIGIFACAHNGDFGNKGYIRATFDHLSFTPVHVYQIGQAGVPPAAGPVPKNWSTI